MIYQILNKKQISKETLDRFGVRIFSNGKCEPDCPSYWEKYFRKYNTDMIVFPLYNLYGGLKGFVYRTAYSKSFYEKEFNTNVSKLVYGLNVTHIYMAQQDYVYIVEGLFDLLKLFDNGIKNVVCTMGAKLSVYQMSLMARFVKSFIICYDSDKAGIIGSNKAVSIIKNSGYNVYQVLLGKDPDEYVAEYGKEGFIKKCIEQMEYTTTIH